MTLQLKILLFYKGRGEGGGFWRTELQLNPIHHTASLSTDLATLAGNRPGKGRTVPALLASIFSCGNAPTKDIFVYFKVLWWQHIQSRVLRLSKTQSTPMLWWGAKQSGPRATFSWPNASSLAFTQHTHNLCSWSGHSSLIVEGWASSCPFLSYLCKRISSNGF